jgi:hypothetical protein
MTRRDARFYLASGIFARSGCSGSLTVEHVQVNRAPVLTLWLAVVARGLGFDRDEALSMGRVVAGLDAYAKGKSLGLYKPHPKTLPDQRKHLESGTVLRVELLKRIVPMMQTAHGLRAWAKDRPVDPGRA